MFEVLSSRCKRFYHLKSKIWNGTFTFWRRYILYLSRSISPLIFAEKYNFNIYQMYIKCSENIDFLEKIVLQKIFQLFKIYKKILFFNFKPTVLKTVSKYVPCFKLHFLDFQIFYLWKASVSCCSGRSTRNSKNSFFKRNRSKSNFQVIFLKYIFIGDLLSISNIFVGVLLFRQELLY